ncbi:unnamed protein product [Amoebophrya sp. A120]|nr:unnamed protein product [Amoebophrya sp. A120]|eukprot:GSA120T00010968001.1
MSVFLLWRQTGFLGIAVTLLALLNVLGVGTTYAVAATANLYDVLGINRSATAAEIKRAFRQRSLEAHPDKKGSDTEFLQVKEAYDVLRDPNRRRLYDRGVQTQSPSSRQPRRPDPNKADLVITTVKQLLDFESKHSEKFVLLHVFHGTSRLDTKGGDWVSELEDSEFFRFANVPVFQADSALLEHLGVTTHPCLVLVHSDLKLRSDPFTVSETAFQYDLVAETVRFQAVRQTGAPYKQLVQYLRLNENPDEQLLQHPDGSGCLRVIYLARTEDENFELFMLALRRDQKYPFACFFHVLPPDLARAELLEADREQNEILDGPPGTSTSGDLRNGKTTTGSFGAVKRADGIEELYQQIQSSPYVLIDPVTDEGIEVPDLHSLQEELGRHAHEKQFFLREANSLTIPNGRFLVLFLPRLENVQAANAKARAARNLSAYRHTQEFCERVAKEGMLACFWMRASEPWNQFLGEQTARQLGLLDLDPDSTFHNSGAGAAVGQATSTNGINKGQQHQHQQAEQISKVANNSCPRVALFDGPTRLIGVFLDEEREVLSQKSCFEGSGLDAATRYWWLRHRGRKAQQLQGVVSTPAFPLPNFLLENPPRKAPENFQEYLERYVFEDLAFVADLVKQELKARIAEAKQVLGRDLHYLFEVFVENYEICMATFFVLVCTILFFAIQNFIKGPAGGPTPTMRPNQFFFAVTVQRDSVQDCPWGVQLKSGPQGSSSRTPRLFMAEIYSDKALFRWNEAHARLQPFRPQKDDVIRVANGETDPERILQVFGREKVINLILHRPNVYNVGTNAAVVVDRVDFLPEKVLREVLKTCTQDLHGRQQLEQQVVTVVPGCERLVLPSMRGGLLEPQDLLTHVKRMPERADMLQVHYMRMLDVSAKKQVALRVLKLQRETTQTSWGMDIMGTTRQSRRVSKFAASLGFRVGDKICLVTTMVPSGVQDNCSSAGRGLQEEPEAGHQASGSKAAISSKTFTRTFSDWPDVLRCFKHSLQIEEVVVLRWMSGEEELDLERNDLAEEKPRGTSNVRRVQPEAAENFLLTQFGARKVQVVAGAKEESRTSTSTSRSVEQEPASSSRVVDSTSAPSGGAAGGNGERSSQQGVEMVATTSSTQHSEQEGPRTAEPIVPPPGSEELPKVGPPPPARIMASSTKPEEEAPAGGIVSEPLCSEQKEPFHAASPADSTNSTASSSIHPGMNIAPGGGGEASAGSSFRSTQTPGAIEEVQQAEENSASAPKFPPPRAFSGALRSSEVVEEKFSSSSSFSPPPTGAFGTSVSTSTGTASIGSTLQMTGSSNKHAAPSCAATASRVFLEVALPPGFLYDELAKSSAAFFDDDTGEGSSSTLPLRIVVQESSAGNSSKIFGGTRTATTSDVGRRGLHQGQQLLHEGDLLEDGDGVEGQPAVRYSYNGHTASFPLPPGPLTAAEKKRVFWQEKRRLLAAIGGGLRTIFTDF